LSIPSWPFCVFVKRRQEKKEQLDGNKREIDKLKKKGKKQQLSLNPL